ncbi:MAG: M1 family aminopeptidase, partial [Terriglobales bacterium]
SEWRSEIPLAVGGFNFGQMKRKEVRLEKEQYLVEAYANEGEPNWVRSVQQEGSLPTLGSQPETFLRPTAMNTTVLMDKALAEGQLSVMLFTDYFGPAPYQRVALTQQTACGFGQAWPGLVYLPMCSFFDSTTRFALFRNLSPQLVTYFKVVSAHEVAHQWWGHTVGWSSYRDQWMSEGFAHMSASLFVQVIQKNDKEFIQFWNDLRRDMTEKNQFGFRAIDVGPVTMGYRVNSTRTGYNIYRDLVYTKGAYILHMLRMMMRNQQTRDDRFKAMMKDFVKTYSNQPATTEDFKAMVEKHMAPQMDLDGNRRMDWFFNQYVYGTAFPDYKFEQSTITGSDGKPALSFKVTQSNVDPQFKMIVTIYADFGSGKVGRLGTLSVQGNSSQDA